MVERGRDGEIEGRRGIEVRNKKGKERAWRHRAVLILEGRREQLSYFYGPESC